MVDKPFCLFNQDGNIHAKPGDGNCNRACGDSGASSRLLHVDADTRASLLKPLAGRAVSQSPNNLYIWRLLFKFNSKRKTYAGREQESKFAMLGAIARDAYDSKGGLRVWDAGTSVKKYFDADGSSRDDPWTLHMEFLDVMKSHKLIDYFGAKSWRYPKDGNRGITGEGRKDIPNANATILSVSS